MIRIYSENHAYLYCGFIFAAFILIHNIFLTLQRNADMNILILLEKTLIGVRVD